MDSAHVEPGRTPRIRVSTRSGSVDVETTTPDTIEVSGGRIHHGALSGEFEVKARGWSRVVLRCPEGSDIIVGTHSGAVDIQGRLGRVSVTTSDGGIKLARADRADLRGGRGDIDVGSCDELRIRFGSGTVRVGATRDAEIAIANGRVEVEDGGRVRVKAANGNVTAKVSGDTRIETIAGKVHVAVSDGLKPSVRYRSFHGSRRNDCPEGDDLRVNIQTISGDIEVVPA
ncbi:MAG TPA: DUF4097 family beta strand repeat-containing protein [Dehalococcoidia bacterium]|jgi:DUF4097 and DUF4098 domain-containing protein YvlB